jgi:DNA replication protein DnaD
LDQAREFVEEFGGEILEVNTEDLDIVIDNLEYPHAMVRDRISAEYVKRI